MSGYEERYSLCSLIFFLSSSPKIICMKDLSRPECFSDIGSLWPDNHEKFHDFE